MVTKYASGEGCSFWSDWAWVFVLLGALFVLVFGGLVFVYYALKSAGIGLL